VRGATACYTTELITACSVAFRCCGEVSLINYTKHGTPFRHTVCVEPLVNSYGQLRVFVARSKDIQLLSSDHIDDASCEE